MRSFRLVPIRVSAISVPVICSTIVSTGVSTALMSPCLKIIPSSNSIKLMSLARFPKCPEIVSVPLEGPSNVKTKFAPSRTKITSSGVKPSSTRVSVTTIPSVKTSSPEASTGRNIFPAAWAPIVSFPFPRNRVCSSACPKIVSSPSVCKFWKIMSSISVQSRTCPSANSISSIV